MAEALIMLGGGIVVFVAVSVAVLPYMIRKAIEYQKEQAYYDRQRAEYAKEWAERERERGEGVKG